MRLPRTETALAAVLLLSAAPFALAAPPPASNTPPASTSAMPGTMAPQTAPGTTTNATSSGWSHSHTMRMHSAGWVPQSDIQAAKNAKVSLTDAINTVQQKGHGNVVSARFELLHGKPEYLIKTFDTQTQKEGLCHISANSGKMIGKAQTIALKSLPMEAQKELTASNNASTSLAQAVQSAEQQRGGKAVAAGLSEHMDHVSYRTELVTSNGMTQMAMINPSSGKVSRYR